VVKEFTTAQFLCAVRHLRMPSTSLVQKLLVSCSIGIRGKGHPRTGHNLDWTSALDGGWWSMPHPSYFTTGKETQYPTSVNPIIQYMSFHGMVKHHCSFKQGFTAHLSAKIEFHR